MVVARILAAAVALAALPAAAFTCSPVTLLLAEDFVDPAGWVRDPPPDPGGGHTEPTWHFDNPAGRVLPTLSEPFAIADSDYTPVAMDTTLTSPVLDAASFTCLTLSFNHHYRAHGSQKGDVDVRSAATGGLWVTVASYTTVDNVAAVSIDLSPYAAADLEVAFHFYDAVFDWYWAIDDVAVAGESDLIFGDGFESGGTGEWSSATAAAPPPDARVGGLRLVPSNQP